MCTTSGAGYGGCNKTLEREKRQIKPAREWSDGCQEAQHTQNASKIVRVRVCDVLYSVHWNILCPCAFSSYFSTQNDESKHKLLQELLKIVDGFDVSPYDDEKTEVILDFKNLYLIYIK